MASKGKKLNAMEKELMVRIVCDIDELLSHMHKDKNVDDDDLSAVEPACRNKVRQLAKLLDSTSDDTFSSTLIKATKSLKGEKPKEYRRRMMELLQDAEENSD